MALRSPHEKSLILSLLLICFCMPSSLYAINAKLKVGIVFPQSGSAQPLGEDYIAGMRLALQDHIRKSPQLEARIQLVPVDGQGEPRKVAMMAEQLITKHRVHALIGSLSENLNDGLVEVARQRQKITLVPTMDPNRYDPQSSVFSFAPSESLQARLLADFTVSQLNLKKVIVFRRSGDPYGERFSRSLQQLLPRQGGQLVGDYSLLFARNELQRQLDQIPSDPDIAIVVPAHHREAQMLLQEHAARKLPHTILGGTDWDHRELYELKLTRTQPQHYFISAYSPRLPSPMIQGFSQRFAQTFQRTASDVAFLGYNAMDLLISTFLAANSNRTPALKRALQSAQRLSPLLGPIQRVENGEIHRQIPIMQISSKGVSMVKSHTTAKIEN